MNFNTLKNVTKASNSSVTDVTKQPSLDHFVTLVTDLKKDGVTPFPIEMSHLSRLSQDEKSTSFVETQKSPKINFNPAFEWIAIAIEEGHIEPSQPSVGRIIGWPQRQFNTHSLSTDFIVWCRKQRIDIDIFDQEALLSFLDKILIRVSNKYEFPPLEICRQKFDELAKQLTEGMHESA